MQTRYDMLRNIIVERQTFEKENQILPFKRYPTTLDYYDIQGYTLLHYAAEMGDLAQVEVLLHEGASIDKPVRSKKDTALVLAFQKGHIEIAEFLKDKGAGIYKVLNIYSKYSICQAWKRDVFIAELKNEKLSFFEKMKIAAIIGDIDYIKKNYEKHEKILRHKVQKKDGYAEKKLFLLKYAAEHGNRDLVKWLVENGSPLDMRVCQFINSPLHLAISNEHTDIASYLIEQGANLTWRNRKQRTPLMFAIYFSNIEIIKLLFSHSVRMSDTDLVGKTVYHFANNPDVINLLFQQSQHEQLKHTIDKHGKRPIDYAIANKNDAVIALFDPHVNIAELKLRRAYGRKMIEIPHYTLLNNIYYFMDSQYRNTEYLSKDGVCAGVKSLWNYYSKKEMSDYFFYIQDDILCRWDGSKEKLFLPLEEPVEDFKRPAKVHKNLFEAFEEWISHINWFQHAKTLRLETNIKPQDFNKQYDLIKPQQDNDDLWCEIYYKADIMQCNFQILHEDLANFCNMPFGAYMYLYGKHATCSYINRQEKIEHFDSNFPRFMPFNRNNVADYAKLIFATQYVVTDSNVSYYASFSYSAASYFHRSDLKYLLKCKEGNDLVDKIFKTHCHDKDDLKNKNTILSGLFLDAIMEKNYGLFGLFKREKTLINSTSKSGITPLLTAISLNDKLLFKELLIFGADPNVGMHLSGNTCLHYLAMNRNLSLDDKIHYFALLASHPNFKINVRNNEDKTAKMYLKKQDHELSKLFDDPSSITKMCLKPELPPFRAWRLK
jgi:ankyrin repeat protein